MACGFVCLAVVLSWRVSISLEMAFCIDAAKEAMAHHGTPEIFSTESGLPVHVTRIHRHADGKPDPHQHGRQGLLAGQRVRRTAVAHHEVRSGIPESLLLGIPRQGIVGQVLRVLQPAPAAPDQFYCNALPLPKAASTGRAIHLANRVWLFK